MASLSDTACTDALTSKSRYNMIQLPLQSDITWSPPACLDHGDSRVLVWQDSGVEVRVFSGRSNNIEGPSGVSRYVPVTMLDARLDSTTSNSSGGDDETLFTQ